MKVEMKGGPDDGETYLHVRARKIGDEDYMAYSGDEHWLVPIRVQYTKTSGWKHVAVWDMRRKP